MSARDFGRYTVQEDVTLGEIAAALAKINRFAGKTRVFFSVAQHSVIVAEQLAAHPVAACHALVHDAHEFITSDIPTVVKAEINRLAGEDIMRIVEEACDSVILPALGLEYPVPEIILAAIARADARAFATEYRDIALELPYPVDPGEALPKVIGQGWPWPKAEENFIKCWDRLAPLAGLPAAKRRAA